MQYEVTQAQYEAVMTGNTETDSNGNVISATPSNWPNNPDRPMEMVSWDDIQVFLTRLNAHEGGIFLRGGLCIAHRSSGSMPARQHATAYSWGDTIASDEQLQLGW